MKQTPIDIFGDVTLGGSPELNDDAIPEVIARFAKDAAERMGVTPEMIAIPAVAVAAGAVPDEFMIQPKEHDTTWKESARLWVGMIADPGQKKTPALKAAVACRMGRGSQHRAGPPLDAICRSIPCGVA